MRRVKAPPAIRVLNPAVALPETSGPLRSCRFCGGGEGRLIMRDKMGPHTAMIRCNTCDAMTGWASRDLVAELTREVA